MPAGPATVEPVEAKHQQEKGVFMLAHEEGLPFSPVKRLTVAGVMDLVACTNSGEVGTGCAASDGAVGLRTTTEGGSPKPQTDTSRPSHHRTAVQAQTASAPEPVPAPPPALPEAEVEAVLAI